MGRSKTLAQQIAELDEPVAKDFDPEEDAPPKGSDDESDSEEEDENAGTEHYVAVGKSKLRKKDEVALGPKYEGSRVSRQALLEDDAHDLSSEDEDAVDSGDFADPETVDMDIDQEDGDIDSDNAFGESDTEKFKEFTFRGSGKPRGGVLGRQSRKKAADFMSGSEEEDADDMDEDADSDASGGVELNGAESDEDDEDDEENNGNDDSEEDEAEQSGSDAAKSDEDEDEDSESGSDDAERDSDDEAQRAELRKIMNTEQKSVIATISQAAKADTDKGIAVKQQRKTFDSLLNVRIRLQKALVATNSMAALDAKAKADPEHEEPYRAAEEAAINLLNTLCSMQTSLAARATPTGTKRKRSPSFTTATPSSVILQALRDSAALALPVHNATLEKWSVKTRLTTPITQRHLALNAVTPTSLTSTLQSQLAAPAHLIARTRIARSCAPIQASAPAPTTSTSGSGSIYDDADFYQLLLKTLVEQRMLDPSSSTLLSTSSLNTNTRQWTAAITNEAKTRKIVDKRASKGRKMRFTVHEKLQNFMAPEDRGSWEEDAVGRFFGSLLGGTLMGGLGEGEGEGEEEEEEEADGGEEEALMLFRSNV